MIPLFMSPVAEPLRAVIDGYLHTGSMFLVRLDTRQKYFSLVF